MFRTAILNYPLKIIQWLRNDIYKKSPEKRTEAEQAIQKFYDKAKMERRGVTKAMVNGPHHNDPLYPDPKGEHWTVDMIKESGEFVTRRHVYPEDKKEEKTEKTEKEKKKKEKEEKQEKKKEKKEKK